MQDNYSVYIELNPGVGQDYYSENYYRNMLLEAACHMLGVAFAFIGMYSPTQHSSPIMQLQAPNKKTLIVTQVPCMYSLLPLHIVHSLFLSCQVVGFNQRCPVVSRTREYEDQKHKITGYMFSESVIWMNIIINKNGKME